MGVNDPQRVFKGAHPVKEVDKARMMEISTELDSLPGDSSEHILSFELAQHYLPTILRARVETFFDSDSIQEYEAEGDVGGGVNRDEGQSPRRLGVQVIYQKVDRVYTPPPSRDSNKAFDVGEMLRLCTSAPSPPD